MELGREGRDGSSVPVRGAVRSPRVRGQIVPLDPFNFARLVRDKVVRNGVEIVRAGGLA